MDPMLLRATCDVPRAHVRTWHVARGTCHDSPMRPLVYAHRGGSLLRPENTIAAFDHGAAVGADGFELDVHLSRDGIVVVHHDPTLDRTTSAQGELRALTADELSGVDAGYWFSAPSGAGSPRYPYRGCG